MVTYKAIVTITWQFNSSQSYAKSLQYAKNKLEDILDCAPYGEEYGNFIVQMSLAKLKSKKNLEHIAEFKPDEIFKDVTEKDFKKEYKVNGVGYSVKMNSDRCLIFKDNRKCVCCNLEGTKMILDLSPGDQSPHFNLYGEENGRLILMTKDHINAKSKGGENCLENYATCCAICNNLKADYNITYKQVFELRELYDNNEKLPRKEVRKLISQRREEMAKS